MAEPIVSIARIRRAAEEAAKKPGIVGCPPELQLFQHVWSEEYSAAIERLAAAADQEADLEEAV